MKALFAVLNMGLGHATRSLGLINSLLEKGIDITVASTGRSLHLLKDEFKDSNSSITFIDVPDYAIKYSSKIPLIIKLMLQAPSLYKKIKWEKKYTSQLIKENNYDLIISDHRYGFFHPKVPSFFITHQITLMPPCNFNWIKKISTNLHSILLKNFNMIIIPDFPGDANLSGELSHFYIPENINVQYARPLYSMEQTTDDHKGEEYDILALISGPEPQRTILENKLNAILKKFPGKAAMVLGKPEGLNKRDKKNGKKETNGLKIFSHLNRKELHKLMTRSKIIISRSGYTTVMEVAGLKKKAVFIPTPGQSEQEYLADYYSQKKWYGSIKQKDINKLHAYLENIQEEFIGFPEKINVKENYHKTADFIISQVDN